mgnify:CR=1 FL=1
MFAEPARLQIGVGVGLVIANVMEINPLALDRFKKEMTANRDVIEAGLSLRAQPRHRLPVDGAPIANASPGRGPQRTDR